jgi:hypothetical protein
MGIEDKKPAVVGVTGGALGLSALEPSYLMHQLPGLDNQKFPPWDGKVFAAKVNETLAASDQKSSQ